MTGLDVSLRSARCLVLLLARDFAALVGLAFVPGTPVAYVALTRWLEGFAYRVDLGAAPFVLAGALGIALLAMSYQSVRAAPADPVKSLRYE